MDGTDISRLTCCGAGECGGAVHLRAYWSASCARFRAGDTIAGFAATRWWHGSTLRDGAHYWLDRACGRTVLHRPHDPTASPLCWGAARSPASGLDYGKWSLVNAASASMG